MFEGTAPVAGLDGEPDTIRDDDASEYVRKIDAHLVEINESLKNAYGLPLLVALGSIAVFLFFAMPPTIEKLAVSFVVAIIAMFGFIIVKGTVDKEWYAARIIRIRRLKAYWQDEQARSLQGDAYT